MQNGPVRLLFVHADATERFRFNAAFGYGFDLSVASSGREALRHARRFEVGVVVVDHSIPDMDPYTLVELLHPVRPEAAFVIVADDSVEVRRTGRPVAARVESPWSEGVMRSLLARVVERHRAWRADAESDGTRKRVLLVDPPGEEADAVRSRLNRLGWGVTRVDTLELAEEAMLGESFRVVLGSIELPDASGLEVVRGLRTLAPNTPLVMLTPHGDPVLESQCVALGAQDCVARSGTNLVYLGRALRHAIARQRAMAAAAPRPEQDPVTGLMDRKAYLAALHRTLSRCRRSGARFAVMALELDRFSAMESRLGREAADVLLRGVGDRIADSVRVYDSVARIGRDDFAVVLEELKAPGEEEIVAERLLRSFTDPFVVGTTSVSASASIGVAVYPEAGETVAALVEQAECAMHAAKSRGGNSHAVYVPAEVEPERRMLEEIEEALHNGEMHFDYQPQYQLRDGTLVGFEALLRWRKSSGRVVMPSEILPVLEKSDLIFQLGTRSIGWACDRLSALRSTRSGRELRVAVNLSSRQFEDPLLPQTIDSALRTYNLPAWALELEITEGVLMRDTERTRQTLDALKEIGVRLTVDDFGTGYSSLAYLRRFRIDALKVDRSFVAELVSSEEARTIADAIIGLGHRLGLEIVAEGVENEAQLAQLEAYGCDIGQGYFLGMPAPMEANIELGPGLMVRLTG